MQARAGRLADREEPGQRGAAVEVDVLDECPVAERARHPLSLLAGVTLVSGVLSAKPS